MWARYSSKARNCVRRTAELTRRREFIQLITYFGARVQRFVMHVAGRELQFIAVRMTQHAAEVVENSPDFVLDASQFNIHVVSHHPVLCGRIDYYVPRS